MRRVPVVLFLLLTTVGTLAGCGGSVADRDRPLATRAAAPPASPFCTALQASMDATAPLQGRSGVPAEELSNAVDAARTAGSDLVQAAPSDLRADVERYVSTLDLQLQTLLDNGGDANALRTDPAVTRAVNEPDTVAAGQRIQTYVQRTCPTAAR